MLEKIIEQNTAAVKDLTAAVNKLFEEAEMLSTGGLTEVERRADEEAAASRPAKNKKTKPAKAKTAMEEAREIVEEEPEQPEEEPDLDIAALRAVLAPLGRDRGLEILSKHHASKLSELHADNYQAVYDAATKKDAA